MAIGTNITPTNKGAARLCRHVNKQGLRETSRQLAIDPSHLSRLLAGTHKPTYAMRILMRDAYRIPLDSWEIAITPK